MPQQTKHPHSQLLRCRLPKSHLTKTPMRRKKSKPPGSSWRYETKRIESIILELIFSSLECDSPVFFSGTRRFLIHFEISNSFGYNYHNVISPPYRMPMIASTMYRPLDQKKPRRPKKPSRLRKQPTWTSSISVARINWRRSMIVQPERTILLLTTTNPPNKLNSCGKNWTRLCCGRSTQRPKRHRRNWWCHPDGPFSKTIPSCCIIITTMNTVTVNTFTILWLRLKWYTTNASYWQVSPIRSRRTRKKKNS